MTRNDEKTDLAEVIALSEKHSNVTGGVLDDFFHVAPAEGQPLARYGVDDLSRFREALHAAPARFMGRAV